MNDPKDAVFEAIWAVFLSLFSLIAGITCIWLGSNGYIATGVLFLLLYINSQKE
jgi:hypothetical protein